MGQIVEKVKGTMKKNRKRETGCKSAVEWKRDIKRNMKQLPTVLLCWISISSLSDSLSD